METNEIPLERLRDLASVIDSSGLNLFLGAGISRSAPTCGPIWSEMQVGFLHAIFDRMEAEDWSVASEFPVQREKVQKIDVRPELFWREMIGITGESVIWKALGAAGAGLPNENHARVAALLKNRRCKWAITTNFDEHIEPFLGNDVPVAIPTDDTVLPDLGSSAYLKLHGSLGVGRSLSYTLEHYNELEQRHAHLLEAILPGRPLVIAGYSGYDIDVLPALRSLAHRMPWIVVIRHPGSPNDQPILQLAVGGSHAYVLESACERVLEVLTEGLAYGIPGLEPESSRRDSASCYSESVGEIAIHLCPVILMAAFRLVGAWELARKYAWLTHDALTDTRYRSTIPDREYQSLHQSLALGLKLAGDPFGAQIMLSEAKASIAESGGGLSISLRQLQVEALTKDAPSQAGKGQSSATRTSLPGVKASDIIAVGLELARNPGKREIFEENWKIGITRRREGSPGRAIEAFNEAAAIVLDDVVTHLERGRFLLDFGGAVYEHAVELQDDELAQQAHLIFQSCDKCTHDSGDWATNARANLMLARLYTNGGSFTGAWEHIRLARQAVARTEDAPLSARIEDFAHLLERLQERFEGGDAEV